MRGTKPKPRPYTDEDRRRLLAPIRINVICGKTHGGRVPSGTDAKGQLKQSTRDRYGWIGDVADLDSIN